ncbi:hemolysin BL lytic component L2, partial [Bacillus pseudomycoides]
MKNKIIKGFLITSIVTGATIPINTLATPIVQAETQQENTDISSSLRKLGAQSKLIQTYIDQALMSPNVQLEEVPSLNTNQSLIKQDMNEWSSELYPKLVLLNSKSKGFVNQFNSYYPTLKEFVDNKEDKEGFLDRLEVLQDKAMTNQENVQRQINELTDLKLQLDKKLQDLDTDVTKAQGVLSSDGTGKIDQLKNELLNTQKSI